MIALNHTIVWCRDKRASADHLTGVLGLPGATPYGHFLVVEMDNGVSMDFSEPRDPAAPIAGQHYAFLVDDAGFDDAFGRIDGRQEYWADPMQSRPGEINRRHGGRGVYFASPDGHLYELLTRPYGSGG